MSSVFFWIIYASYFSYICNMKTAFPNDIIKHITSSLENIYEAHEIESMAYHIVEQVYELSKVDVLVNDKIEDNQEKALAKVIKKLLDFEPIQHIFGYADFYGHQFIVNEHVLIPRQETEELIQMIINENQAEKLNVLDIGTGSGCIACSLALGMNDAHISALDLSSKALEVAKSNAEHLACDISFIQSDILNDKIPISQLDIIVSNPPYVLESEKKLMSQNVLDFEPELALFVPNQSPLLFYKVISEKAKNHLKKGAKLYFEINEAFGNEVATLMKVNGFDHVEIHKDLNGKDRFVSGEAL